MMSAPHIIIRSTCCPPSSSDQSVTTIMVSWRSSPTPRPVKEKLIIKSVGLLLCQWWWGAGWKVTHALPWLETFLTLHTIKLKTVVISWSGTLTLLLLLMTGMMRCGPPLFNDLSLKMTRKPLEMQAGGTWQLSLVFNLVISYNLLSSGLCNLQKREAEIENTQFSIETCKSSL